MLIKSNKLVQKDDFKCIPYENIYVINTKKKSNKHKKTKQKKRQKTKIETNDKN